MQNKVTDLRPRLDFSAEEVARFQQMQEELDQFNNSLSTRHPLPEPQYDRETFHRFRMWQEQTMLDKHDRYRAANPLPPWSKE